MEENAPIVDLDFDNVVEPSVVPDGQYQLMVVTTPQVKDSKSTEGNKYIEVRFEILGQPTAKEVIHRLSMPKAGDSDKVRNEKSWRIKAMCQALGIVLSGSLDLSELVGRDCWAKLSTESDPVYGDKNRIDAFITAQG